MVTQLGEYAETIELYTIKGKLYGMRIISQ